MLSTLPLRPYQRQDVDAIYTALAGGQRPTGTGVVNRPAVEVATGLGKTVMFATLSAEQLERRSGLRVLVLVHRDELAKQTRATIHGVAPSLRVGLVKGSQNEIDGDVTVASVQTLGASVVRERRGTPAPRAGYRHHQIRGIGLIIVDECHHAAADTWRATLEYFGAFNGVPTIGFTATMSREDGRGLGEIWQEVVAKRDIQWGIKNGYLAPVRGLRIQVPDLNLRGINVDGGVGAQNDVGQAMLDANTGPAIAKAVTEHAPDRRGPVFAPNIAAAENFAESLNDSGHPAATVTGATPLDDRAKIYRDLDTGVLRWVVSVGVLTEGWDWRAADCAVMARPTKSKGLYIQMGGRILRSWDGSQWLAKKRDALFLDMVGVTSNHDLIGLTDLSLDPEPTEPKDTVSRIKDLDEWDDDFEDSPAQPIGQIVAKEVDLFGDSPSAWLTTFKGVRFIPAKDWLFFLWPDMDDGLWSVGAQAPTGVASQMIGGCPLDIAIAWCERYATEADPSISSRGSSWRKRPKPSLASGNLAIQLGVWDGVEKITQGALSDRIDVAKASRRLDR